MGDRAAALAAAVAAAAFTINAGIQITSPHFDPHISGTRDWLNEITFTIAVAAALAGVLGLARAGVVARRPALVAAAGFGLLLAGLLPEYPGGESPEWFAAVGVPGNLLCLAGLGWAALVARRSRTVPAAVIPLMPLSVLIGVGLAEFGGGLVAAAWWACATALLLRPSPRFGSPGRPVADPGLG